MHIIAAKAVALKEAMSDKFRAYQGQVIKNAQAMAQVMTHRGFHVVSGGTDCHMFLLDLRSKKITGKEAEPALGKVGITVNKNSIPSDVQRPTVAGGIRIGTPAVTTRRFSTHEVSHIATLTADLLEDPKNEQISVRVSKEVRALAARFPVYQNLGGRCGTKSGLERGPDDRQQSNAHC